MRHFHSHLREFPHPCQQARRQDFAAGGAKNHKGGPNFFNTILNVYRNWELNMKWGGTDFKWGGRAPLPPR